MTKLIMIIFVTLSLGVIQGCDSVGGSSDSTSSNKEKKKKRNDHGGAEHGGELFIGPDGVRTTMMNYIESESLKNGVYTVKDELTGKTRHLSLVRIHDRVGKTGELYYACADFKDLDTNEVLDLDIDIRSRDGQFSVEEIHLHKVGGLARYTYDNNDNRIPVK